MNEQTTTEKTQEELAAEAAAKAAAKQKKDEEKAEAKKLKDEQKAKEKAEKAAAKEKEKADKEQAKKDAEAKKLADAAELAKKKEAEKMPEANGVRRPKPETLCGQAWAIFDEISANTGAPAQIKAALEVAKTRNLNEGNVRVEYARWRKFFGISGRLQAPAAETLAATETAPAGDQPTA